MNAQDGEEFQIVGAEGREKIKDHILEDFEDLELNSKGEV